VSAARKLLSYVLLFGLGSMLAVGGIELMALHAAPAALVAPGQRVGVTGQRFWYAPGEYPRLSLPGGQTRTIRSVLSIRQRLRYGDFVWDDNGIPAGPVWVRADLDRQLISVFRDGHEIGTAVILYGADGKPTPAGTFPVLQKAADYHSMTYDAPMPYMLRLTRDGVAIHGSDVRRGAATHGCIGVPTAFARLLFEQMQLGDPVMVVGSLPPANQAR